MAQQALDDILSRLGSLAPEELEQLGQAVRKRLTPHEEEEKHAAFHRRLLSSGLVLSFPQRRRERAIGRALGQIQGEPVSQTIIEERR